MRFEGQLPGRKEVDAYSPCLLDDSIEGHAAEIRASYEIYSEFLDDGS